MSINSKHILISEGNRPIWHAIIAALFFVFSLVIIYQIILGVYNAITLNIPFLDARHFATALTLSVVLAIRFSMVKRHYFDLLKQQHKNVKTFGPLEIGSWKPLEHLEYISIFKTTKNRYEMNLWYNTNKHYKLALFSTKKESLEQGQLVAKTLKIKLLDATNPKETLWVELG